MPFSLIIQEISRRIPFKQEEFDLFVQKVKLVRLKKNEIWEREGQISQLMGFVNKGMLRQYYLKDGNEFTDCFFSEGEFIGNYISYLSKEVSRINTIALEACELLVIPFREMEALYDVLPITKKFSEIIGNEKLVELNKRNSALLMDRPEERYQQLLKDKPDLHQRVPLYLIAQYLGIRPETLSRIRKRHFS